MQLHFYKYQGAGNDFVIIDNREKSIQLTTEQIALLCHRNFGIGADGLMLLEAEEGYDFRMVYYNADGNESTMCGNGGRSIALFAHQQCGVGTEMHFIAIDGPHKAKLIAKDTVALEMADVKNIIFYENAAELNTGSPHYIQWVDDVNAINVYQEGKAIRNNEQYHQEGINVNFVAKNPDHSLHIRTYERGVENETLACGTGVTAAAIASVGEKTGEFTILVKAMGGDLSVSFKKESANTASQVVLTGPAKFVFKGVIEI